MTKKNEVQTLTGAANADVPDFLRDKMNDNRGNENVTSSDVTVPRIEICQSLSECRKKNSPEFIEGIEEGNLYNNITRAIYGDSVRIVPVAFKLEYLLWRDLKAGGGFGGAFESAELANIAREAMEKPEEYEVVDTPQHFVLVVDANDHVSEAVISMARSKAKISRNFNALIRMNEGPRFSRVYNLRGVSDQNNAGQDYYNIAVSNHGFVTEELFKRAEGLYNLIVEGKVTADRSTEKTSENSEF